MADNLVRKGDNSPKSVKMNAYNRAEKIEKLGYELPMKIGDLIDELIEDSQQLQKAQAEIGDEVRENLRKAERQMDALGLD